MPVEMKNNSISSSQDRLFYFVGLHIYYVFNAFEVDRCQLLFRDYNLLIVMNDYRPDYMLADWLLNLADNTTDSGNWQNFCEKGCI